MNPAQAHTGAGSERRAPVVGGHAGEAKTVRMHGTGQTQEPRWSRTPGHLRVGTQHTQQRWEGPHLSADKEPAGAGGPDADSE